MKKTIVSILSSISFIIAVTLPACSAGKEKIDQPFKNAETTFYPISIGNYWVWQDSFFDQDAYQTALEMTNGEAAIEIRKDSIVNIVKHGNDAQVVIKCITFFREGRQRPTTYDTAIIDNNQTFKYYENLQVKLHLSIGDKIIINGDEFITKNAPSTIENGIDAIPADTSSLKGYAFRFIKGIGQVGSRSKRKASNLIEYRIGNGPVIKKHWLMESPE